MSSVLELPPEMPLPPDPTTPNVSKREWEQAMCMFRQDVLRIGQSGNFESGAQQFLINRAWLRPAYETYVRSPVDYKCQTYDI